MNFYHNLITDKSWQLLLNLRKKYKFILIGGWAVFLYTKALKSKDIDIVCEFSELEKLRDEFPITKNNRLKKYEAKSAGLDIDIYVPFYSNPGLPAEDLKKFTVSIEGFSLPQIEVLAILKQKALMDRANTVKGRKDLIDAVSLFKQGGFDFRQYKKLILKYGLGLYLESTKNIIERTVQLEELGLNVHQMSRFKRRILPQLV